MVEIQIKFYDLIYSQAQREQNPQKCKQMEMILIFFMGKMF